MFGDKDKNCPEAAVRNIVKALLAELKLEKKEPKKQSAVKEYWDGGFNAAIDAYEQKKKELFK